MAAGRGTARRNQVVNASNGTDTTVSAYPVIDSAHCRPVGSDNGPVSGRNTSENASPTLVTNPTSAADAQSWPDAGR
ncbi:hypothetical protein AB0B25_03255 [Nocardia sp. NPDC049190]|uniref:hypothetical protein n=1 Tax=Nocardia sp. NPDC049190 TaxID=3155650 RepID=UPI0033FD0B2B